LSGFHEFLRQAKSDRTAKVKTLSIGGNEAFEIDAGQAATGGYVRSIYGFHHGNQIQLTTGPNMSRTVLPSFEQLRQIVAIIVRRF
jgi:hypothetical protein